MQAAIRKSNTTKLSAVKGSFLAFALLYFLLKISYCSCLSLILSLSRTLYISPHVFVLPVSPCFFYHTPSICPPLFSPPSPPALIMPHFAPPTRSPFLRPLSVSLAGIQGVKVEEEIDSKKDSHVMWRGTKEDPQGLGRLNATHFIPSNLAALQAPPTRATQKNNT